MKTKYKDNYYNDQDEINFDKLNNFRKFNSDIKNTTQSKNHNIRYANSDKNYFNNIIKTEKNLPLFKKIDTEKEPLKKIYRIAKDTDIEKFESAIDLEQSNNLLTNKVIELQKSWRFSDDKGLGKFSKEVLV